MICCKIKVLAHIWSCTKVIGKPTRVHGMITKAWSFHHHLGRILETKCSPLPWPILEGKAWSFISRVVKTDQCKYSETSSLYSYMFHYFNWSLGPYNNGIRAWKTWNLILGLKFGKIDLSMFEWNWMIEYTWIIFNWSFIGSISWKIVLNNFPQYPRLGRMVYMP